MDPSNNITCFFHYFHTSSKSSIREMRSHSNEFIHPGSRGGWNLSQRVMCEMQVMPSKGHRAKTDNTFTQQKCHFIRVAISSELHVEHRCTKEYETSTHTVGLGSNRRPSCHDVIYHASQIHIKCYQLIIIKHARRLCMSCTNFFYFCA